MSAQAVEVLSEMRAIAEVRRALCHTSVIAVGPKTREKLEEVKIRVDFVPADFSSEGIVRMLSGMFPSGKKIIIPRSAEANNQTSQGLRSIGMTVDEVILYSVSAAKPTEQWKDFASLLIDGKVDAVVFTSASSVKAFFGILDKLITKKFDLTQTTQILSIGPCTTLELKKRKIKCSEAPLHTVRGTFELAVRILKG
jgi:uroporphyrinogen-III synthase